MPLILKPLSLIPSPIRIVINPIPREPILHILPFISRATLPRIDSPTLSFVILVLSCVVCAVSVDYSAFAIELATLPVAFLDLAVGCDGHAPTLPLLVWRPLAQINVSLRV
jgi:hypothetical protein